MRLPADHPRRIALNDEVHARPPDALSAPLRLSYLVLFGDRPAGEPASGHAGPGPMADLARRFGLDGPAPEASHHSADLGPFRVTWERHTEFSRFTFVVPGPVGDDPFGQTALAAVPADWLAALPGTVMLAAHAVLLADAADGPVDPEAMAQAVFDGNVLVGSAIGGGVGAAFTDFRIHADGFSRLVVRDRGMTRRQAGRMMQRLLEIDTYRVMALLALPVARSTAPLLTRCERELAGITAALMGDGTADERLLDRLTRLEAEVASLSADNDYRFAAAAAYHDLVRRRIAELREERIRGLQTFQEFTERRLAPAMATCRAVAARQEALSQRVARVTQLLSTRVDVARERQNHAVLESMNRRARLQLRLQQTVEGLSTVAISYYVVGLLGYLAKGARAGGLPVDPDLAAALAIPVVVLLAAFGVRHIRRIVARPEMGR